MAELYLVRHGQASFGSSNYDQLSELGHQQAVWLGEYFAERDVQFDRLITGTQLRHRQTLEGIAKGFTASTSKGVQQNWVAETHPGFNEYDFYALFASLGEQHAHVRAYALGDKRSFYKGLKEVLKLWMTDELDGPLPERWADFYQRVADAMKFATQGEKEKVLVVSSGGPIGTIASQAMLSPPQIGMELNLQVRNSSFCHYFFNQNSLRLGSFNSIPHLDLPQRLNAITYG